MTAKMKTLSLTGMALAMAITLPASAAINVTHYWDLGETNVANGDAVGEHVDVGGFQSGPAFNPSQVNLGTAAPNWDLQNSIGNGVDGIGPIYSADTAPGGSTVSLLFGGNDGQSILSAGHPSTATANFGFELWVKPRDDGSFSRNLLYNGQLGGAENGWGFRTNAGNYEVYMGGAQVLVGSPVVQDQWTHLASVTEWDGVNLATLLTTFYIDGQPVATWAGSPITPSGSINGVPDAFTIGSVRTVNSSTFALLDEVRIFEFAPGAFDASSDLASGFFVPEPGSIVMLTTLLGGVLLRRRSEV